MTKGNIELVTFDEEQHRYGYCGKELKGITGTICKVLGKTYADTAGTALACSYGSQVHRDVENWIERQAKIGTGAGQWCVDELVKFSQDTGTDGLNRFRSEVRVSDFETTASNVDVVLHTPAGVFLFDIKTGRFDRQYCTMQLNAYRVMYENCYDEKVAGLFVLNSKAKRIFRIFATKDEETFKLLEMNR